MWAALKSDVIEFVVYDGFRDNYPKWFNDAIIEYITYDEEYECAILQSRDADPIVLVEGDAFLKNKYGDIWRMTEDDFDTDFYSVEDQWFSVNYAVLATDCIEVIVQNGVFLKSKRGDYHYMTVDEFNDEFLIVESDD